MTQNNTMKRLYGINFLIILLLCCLTNTAAQNNLQISGKVISSTDKEPLIGVAVTEINAENRVLSSAITNYDGDFSIKVSSTKNRLQFSYIGFKKKYLEIGQNNFVKISMEEDVRNLNDVVVIAKQKQQVGNLPIQEREISMAISKLDAGEIADLHVTSVDEAIQGRMSGVDVVANAGDPGSGMSIQIRGTTSINGNNQPLIVVDGMPLETEIGADFDFSTATQEEFSQLLNVAPSDIKEIVVLKDAAANAI